MKNIAQEWKKKYRTSFSFSNISRALNKYGIRYLLTVSYNRYLNEKYDSKYNIDTSQWIKIEDLENGEEFQTKGHEYQPTGIKITTELLKRLAKYKKKHFVDYGSGKGQVLFEASRMGYETIKGVDFSKTLCTIAKKNWSIYKKKTNASLDIEIIESDAAEFDISDKDDMLYFCNPFKRDLLSLVLDKIIENHKNYPREIILVYSFGIHPSEFNKRFELVEEFKIQGIYNRVYRLN